MPFFDDLDETYPDGDVDAGSVIDDELRDIKATILDCFPNVTAAVPVSHHYINRLSGLSSEAQTQFTNLAANITTQEQASYVISGYYLNGNTLSGPYGLDSFNTWTVEISSPGITTVRHNLDSSHGLGINDYIVSATPWPFDDTHVPTVAVSQSTSTFSVHNYNHTTDAFVTVPFSFLIVML